MTRNVESAAEDLAADLAALRKDVAGLAETMGELVQHQTKAAGRSVSETVGEARNKIESAAADAQAGVRAAGAEIATSIERNPLTAVMISFGIGLALGMLSRSRG